LPKVVDHELYRIELLDKSLAYFVAKGMAGVSMRELALSLSVSTGTLYHYFPTKEILFVSMVRHFVSIDAAEILEIAEARRGLFDLISYVSKKEDHFLSLILLALDVKRHHGDSEELTDLLDESWNSYERVLSNFFGDQDSQFAGEAFLSFFVGALFLKSTRSSDTSWSQLLEALGQVSSFLSFK
jgi:AcrR family transcriptional regulator